MVEQVTPNKGKKKKQHHNNNSNYNSLRPLNNEQKKELEKYAALAEELGINLKGVNSTNYSMIIDELREESKRSAASVDVPAPLTAEQAETLSQYAMIASEAGIDLSKINSSNYDSAVLMMEEQYKLSAMQEVETYILDKNADDYSDILGDYLEMEGLTTLKKDVRAHAVLDAIVSTFQQNNDISLDNAIDLAQTIYEITKEPSVAAYALDVASIVTEPERNKLVENILSGATDYSDEVLDALANNNSFEMGEFTQSLMSQHIKRVMEQIGSEHYAEYKEILDRDGYGELWEAVSEQPHIGTINEENDNDVPDYYGVLGVDRTASLDEIKRAWREQVKAYHPDKNFDGAAELIIRELNEAYDILKDEAKRAEYDKMLDGSDTAPKSKGDPTNEDDEDNKKNMPAINKPYTTALAVYKHNSSNTEGPEDKAQDEPQPEETLDWVKKKIKDYEQMKAAGKIAVFEPKPEAKTYFEANVDGATIHYSTPNDVKVTGNANLHTFELILNEPDNLNRVINFTNDMTHDMALYLKAACILNGREMSGAVPEFTQQDMEKLSKAIGTKRYTALLEAVNNQKGLVNKEKQPPAVVKDDKTKTAEDKTKAPDSKTTEDKAKAKEIIIDSPEKLNEVLNTAQNARKELNECYDKGFIAFKTDPETQKKKIVHGPNLVNNPDKDAIWKSVQANYNLLVAITKAHDQYNKKRLEEIRKTMSKDGLAAHDALTPELRAQNLKKLRAEMSIKLGITTDPKGEIKRLEGKELTDYINKQKITQKNYSDLWKEAHDGETFDIKSLSLKDRGVYSQISTAQFARSAYLKNKDSSRA